MARLVVSLVLSGLLAACGGASSPSADEDEDTVRAAATLEFDNATSEVAFVGSKACFDCHEEEYRGYQNHGMAQSYYPVTASDTAVQDVNPGQVFHSAQGLSYRLVRQNGATYQEEFRLDAQGDTTHRLRRKMEYVVGSGTAARTYLTENEGRLYELPLTWYARGQTWNFSPGYETGNLRFNRLIPDRCMSCHNSYPETVPFVEGKYKEVPQGIGCERCHGPGELHVETRLATPEPAGEVDSTIVNPAHLSLDRRLDVCQQCHLHGTVSLLREGRGPFEYRPSEPLSAHVALFSEQGAEGDDQIDVISHADRMKQSVCFVGLREQGGEMDCVTCHGPHEGFREVGPSYFNDTCKDCHGVEQLRQSLTGEAKAAHTPSANCFSCHMPKVEAEDAPHASFTDHKIRVVEETPETTPLPEQEAEELEAYFKRDRESQSGKRYRGMAYVAYGRRNGDTAALQKGASLLEETLAEDPSHGEAQFLLGYARNQLGEGEAAIAALEEAVRLDPDIPERLNALAQAYERAGRAADKAERLYQRALSIQPALAEVRVNYGRFLQAEGRVAEAVRQYQRAIEERSWLATAHYNLGTALLQQEKLREGVDALERAVNLRPFYPAALGNLGSVYAQSGFPERAKTYFERAMEVAPDNAVALGNLGSFYLNRGQRERAIELLRRAVENDPQYVDGTVNLALAYFRGEQYEQARQWARKALELDSDNKRARQILQALP